MVIQSLIHIGIVGGGNISETHARASREIDGVEIAAIYGSNREKCERLGQLYGGVVYEDFEAFLEHRPMDMVAIGSPSGLQQNKASRLHVVVSTSSSKSRLTLQPCGQMRSSLNANELE